MKKFIPSVVITTLALTSAAYSNASDTSPATNTQNDRLPATYAEFYQQVLPEGDGWASSDGGTTGGSKGSFKNVTTWEAFKAAAEDQNPALILVTAPLYAFDVNKSGNGLTCDDFASQVTVEDGLGSRSFSMAEYIKHFDPEGDWGKEPPSGPLEEARREAAGKQRQVIQVRIGSNKTIISQAGIKITGAHLDINNSHNVIIRNIEISDAYDCFPEWSPTDGSSGNWNSAYDNISIRGGSHNVWIDRVALNDGEHPPGSLDYVYDRKFEVHDGLLDISHGSDLVTVSNSIFSEHDKTNLVGASDNPSTPDQGKLRVTWHGNLWKDTGQRTPRVRFGQNDIYNNLFQMTDASLYQYNLGVGVESSIYAEKNVFELPVGVAPQKIIGIYGGTQIRTYNNLVNGQPVDIRAAYNENTSGLQLDDLTNWTPYLRPRVLSVGSVKQSVLDNAGPRVPELCDPVHDYEYCFPNDNEK